MRPSVLRPGGAAGVRRCKGGVEAQAEALTKTSPAAHDQDQRQRREAATAFPQQHKVVISRWAGARGAKRPQTPPRSALAAAAGGNKASRPSRKGTSRVPVLEIHQSDVGWSLSDSASRPCVAYAHPAVRVACAEACGGAGEQRAALQTRRLDARRRLLPPDLRRCRARLLLVSLALDRNLIWLVRR